MTRAAWLGETPAGRDSDRLLINEALSILQVQGASGQVEAVQSMWHVVQQFRLRKKPRRYSDRKHDLLAMAGSLEKAGRVLDPWEIKQAAHDHVPLKKLTGATAHRFSVAGHNEFHQLPRLLADIAAEIRIIIDHIPAEARLRKIGLPPKRRLAVYAWELLWQYRADDTISGHLGGDHFALTCVLFELATGEVPDSDGVGLDGHAKRASRFCRELLRDDPELERARRTQRPGETVIGLIAEIVGRNG